MTLFATAPPIDTGGTFTTLMNHVAQAFEALGAAVLVIGVLWSLIGLPRRRRPRYRIPANRSVSGSDAPVVSVARMNVSWPKVTSATSGGSLLNQESSI